MTHTLWALYAQGFDVWFKGGTSLSKGLGLIERGERNPLAVAEAMRAVVEAEPLATLDYAAAVDAATLAIPEELSGEIRLIIAAQVGRPRLLDNAGATLST